jgi:hypothetical protein
VELGSPICVPSVMYDRFNPFPLKMTQLISLSMCTGIIPSLSKPKQTPLRSDHPSKPNDAETRPSKQTKCRRDQTIPANQTPLRSDHPSKPNAAETTTCNQMEKSRPPPRQNLASRPREAETESRRDQTMQSDIGWHKR